ncbi:MAG: FkbM family methyltransferase [Hyphomicrobiaceae bacterium]
MRQTVTSDVSMIDRALQSWRDGLNHPMKLRLHYQAVKRLRGNLALTSTALGDFVVDQTDYIGRELIGRKTYEPETISLCCKILANGGTFFDVGANLGLYTVALSNNENVEVHSFEPDFTNYQFLLRNVSLNARRNVKTYNFALSSTPGLIDIHLPCATNRGSVRIANGRDAEAAVVATSTVDAVMRHASIPRLDLMKIDVEGHELEVLRGATLSGDASPKHIIVECWGSSDGGGSRPLKDTELFALLIGHGYRCRTIDGQEIGDRVDMPEFNAWFTRDHTSNDL